MNPFDAAAAPLVEAVARIRPDLAPETCRRIAFAVIEAATEVVETKTPVHTMVCTGLTDAATTVARTLRNIGRQTRGGR